MTMMIEKNDPVRAKEFFEDKVAFTIGPVELKHQIDENTDITIIDVREAKDYRQAHIPGVVNLSKEKWDTDEGLQMDRVNIIYCYTQTCHLAAKAALNFAGKGYSVMEMEGGIKAWKEANFPLES